MARQFTLTLPLHEDAPSSLALQQALQRARELQEAGEPPRQVLAQLTSIVESLSPDAVASILLIDGEGLLRNGASPNLPADYLDAIDRLKPDAGVGTCAAAAATGEVVVTPDFQADARWSELRHLPMALGYLSAWSHPIKDPHGRVLGTFGTYFRSRREPTARERQVVAVLAGIAAEVLSPGAA
jgi:GAF domain-containing protein